MFSTKTIIVTLGGRGSYILYWKERNEETEENDQNEKFLYDEQSKFLPPPKADTIVTYSNPIKSSTIDGEYSSNYFHIVDTSGAGDCFIGSFAYFLARGNALEKDVLNPPSFDFLCQCIERSMYIATLSCCKKGCQDSYPTRDQIPPEILNL